MLSAALAAQGRFTDAAALAERALALARQAGQQSLAAEVGQRLRLYRRQQPYLQDAGRS